MLSPTIVFAEKHMYMHLPQDDRGTERWVSIPPYGNHRSIDIYTHTSTRVVDVRKHRFPSDTFNLYTAVDESWGLEVPVPAGVARVGGVESPFPSKIFQNWRSRKSEHHLIILSLQVCLLARCINETDISVSPITPTRRLELCRKRDKCEKSIIQGFTSCHAVESYKKSSYGDFIIYLYARNASYVSPIFSLLVPIPLLQRRTFPDAQIRKRCRQTLFWQEFETLAPFNL